VDFTGNIPKALGAGVPKVVKATFTEWGPLYSRGGVTVTVPQARRVLAPLYADVRSGGYVAKPAEWSGAAVKVLLYYVPDPTTHSGSPAALEEVASGTALSGVLTLDLVAIVDPY